jgi:hypothetical protein
MRSPLPLRRRRWDIVFLVFFLVNILFITYIVDLEQLAIPDPVTLDPPNFEYPIWPTKGLVDMVHWWGGHFDPVQLARPTWWKATIWIDALLFGPYYAFAIYAFIKGKEWIRIPTFLYSGILWTNVVIILSEELWGPHSTPQRGMVILANLPWLVFPMLLVWRMWKEHPFTENVPE